MRKALTAAAIAASALVAPMLGAGTASAAEITPTPPAVGSSISVDPSSAVALVEGLVFNGCTTTFVANVESLGFGKIVTVNGLVVTINGNNAIAYAFGVEGFTVGYVFCVV